MLKRIIVRSVLMGMFVLSLMAIPACQPKTVEPVTVTDDADTVEPVHERHDTGIKSQTSEY